VKRGTDWGAGYEEIEDRLMMAVVEAFGLPIQTISPSPLLPLSVKRADDVLLYTEMRDLMPAGMFDRFSDQETLPYEIECWSPKDSELRFLERYFEIVEG
jgi:hypothetical protein